MRVGPDVQAFFETYLPGHAVHAVHYTLLQVLGRSAVAVDTAPIDMHTTCWGAVHRAARKVCEEGGVEVRYRATVEGVEEMGRGRG